MYFCVLVQAMLCYLSIFKQVYTAATYLRPIKVELAQKTVVKH